MESRRVEAVIADKFKMVLVPKTIAEAVSVDLDKPMALFVGTEIHLREPKIHIEIIKLEDREDGVPIAFVCLVADAVDEYRRILDWNYHKGNT